MTLPSTGRLPVIGSRPRNIIAYLDRQDDRTLEQIIADNPSRFGFKLSELTSQLDSMCQSGLLQDIGGAYRLTTYTLMRIGSEKPEKEPDPVAVATPRTSNVFAESTGAIADHFAGMRRALMGRLA